MYFIQIPHINAKLTHIHFKRKAINDNKLTIVQFLNKLWNLLSQNILRRPHHLIILSRLLLLTHGAEHEGG